MRSASTTSRTDGPGADRPSSTRSAQREVQRRRGVGGNQNRPCCASWSPAAFRTRSTPKKKQRCCWLRSNPTARWQPPVSNSHGRSSTTFAASTARSPSPRSASRRWSPPPAPHDRHLRCRSGRGRQRGRHHRRHLPLPDPGPLRRIQRHRADRGVLGRAATPHECSNLSVSLVRSRELVSSASCRPPGNANPPGTDPSRRLPRDRSRASTCGQTGGDRL